MGRRIETKRAVWRTATGIHHIPTTFLALLIILLSYLAARLGAAMVSYSLGLSILFWPPTALLVAAMLLVPRRSWLVLVPAGLAGAAIENLQLGFTPGATGLFFLGDAIQVLIVGLGLRYCFDGIPQLNSSKALAKYCFFAAFLGPIVSAFIGATAPSGSYAVNWLIWFFTDMLAFLTITPAILSWASEGRNWIHRPDRSAVEAAALLGTLAILGYLVLIAPWKALPSTLYVLVPLLLWAALRFGSLGVSTSMLVISFLSIWGATHGRGPFTGPSPLRNVLSMQVFLIFAAIPFMALAAVVEERASAWLVEKKLSRRLISAQEQERSRIASELHDDICQRLALLSMELQGASRDEIHLDAATKGRLEGIRLHCLEIASDVQLLSHELHSAKLDYVGISAAIRGFCREFGEQQEVSVEFTEQNVPKSISRESSLCLFRVTQEALHNAVKYSGAKQFWVELTAAGNDVRLEVKDAGIGFDTKEADRISGLGLMSMQERVQAVNGRFYLESKPGAGTRIIVSVPMAAGNSAEEAASDTAKNIGGSVSPRNQRSVVSAS